jgi:AcrR family transcriptional regulator
VHKILEREKVQTKEIILRIALKLFMERGFGEVSINELIKVAGITKKKFTYEFNSKDQLINETIKKLFFPHFNDIIYFPEESNESSKEKLERVFERYSEIKCYLRTEIGVRTINYRSIIALLVEGINDYQSMTNNVVDFNNRLLEKIEDIIDEGKLFGEISSEIDSKFISKHILTLLQNAIVLWVMNQNININKLFEVNFKYLWNKIKSPESNLVILENYMVDESLDSKKQMNFNLM